jgi:hypothetical protein
MSHATMLRADTWERVQMSEDIIKSRLMRITGFLNQHHFPYVVVGGNAVAAHMSQVNLTRVRGTKDVDIMIRRTDLAQIKDAAKTAGFFHAKAAGIDMLRDGPKASARDSIHIIFENEKVRPEEPVANPSIDDSILHPDGYRVLGLKGVVQIKLTAFRSHDRTHLIDLLQEKLIDESWIQFYPPPLSDRLRELCELPEVKDYVETEFDEEGN